MKYCANCKAAVDDGANFCTRCGAAFEETNHSHSPAGQNGCFGTDGQPYSAGQPCNAGQQYYPYQTGSYQQGPYQHGPYQPDGRQNFGGQGWPQQPFQGGGYNQPPYYGRPGGYYPQPPAYRDPYKGRAIAGLVLGILGVVLFRFNLGVILSIVGLALSVSSLKNYPKGAPERGYAVGGLICSIVGIFLYAIVFLIVFETVLLFS